MKTITSSFRRAAAVLSVAGLALISVVPESAAQAEKRPNIVLGVVDTDLILQDSLAAKGVRLERDKYANTYQGQIKDMEAKLRAEDQELAQQRGVMAPEVFQQRATAFQQKLADFQNQVRDKQERLDFAFQQAMQEIGNTIMVVSSEVAKTQGVNAVLSRSQLMIFDPSMDMTKPVLERLNQRLASVKFQDPATLQRNADGSPADAPAVGAPTAPAAKPKP